MGSIKELEQMAKRSSKNPLGIIGLFLVLVHGMAGYVARSSLLESYQRLIIILFLVIFPLIVLYTFYLLVTKHHDKLYGPGDFINEENFMKYIDRLQNSIEQIREEIDAQPIYKYTKLSEGGKGLILDLLNENEINLHTFSEKHDYQHEKLLRQAQILNDYEWLTIDQNMGTATITRKGEEELATFEDLCYGRSNGLKRKERMKKA